MADTPNHFFKFVLPGFKFNLSIPKSFLTRLDGWSGKKAILRRGRLKWPVHIDDGGGFGDGWKKFVAENGVQEFDIIVFKHQGNMVFDFFVFDSSGCERQYPNLPDDHVEEHIPESESDSLHTHKRPKMLNKRKRADCSSRSKDEFQLEDDSCFVSIMTPYIIKTSSLDVPTKFARSNGLTSKRMHTQIVVVDQAKRTFPAKLRINTYRIRLRGWRKLIIKNDLKVGDVCMFKLVEDGQVPVFNFYNLGKKITSNQGQVKKENRSTIKKTTGSSLGNHPYFILTMKPSYRKAALYLPVEFWKSNGLKVGEMILRDDEGRSWKIQLMKKKEKYLCFGHGFKAFWDANGLKVGDVYKFVLLQKDKCRTPIMNVSLNVDSALSRKEEQQDFISKVQSYCLYLPSELVKTNGLLNKEKMILKKDDERSWILDIKRERKYSYIGRGWKDFCVANGLKKEDLIKLKPISNGEIPVVKFYVQKAH